ncbi:MAG: TPM domain-containing protein [Myxococcota bacterium]
MVGWFVAVAQAVSVSEVQNPRDAGRWVTDQADVLGPLDEEALNARMEALHRDLDVEIAIVTVPSASAATPKEFASALFAHWGIGDAQANNGLLVLMVLDQRRIEMETGYGLEAVLPDGTLGGIQTTFMVPRFKEGNYGAGLAEGMGQIEARLREHPEDARLGAAGPMRLAADGARRSEVLSYGLYGTLGAGLVGTGGLLVARRRRKQRTCDTCGVYMPLLDEEADDAHLTEGQRSEERIGSVDHQVHQCPQCSAVRTFSVHGWISGYKTCDQCGNRTRTSRAETLSPSTVHSTGRVQITEQCAHCSYSASYVRTTPRLSPPSTHHHSGGFGGSSGGSRGGSSGGSRGGSFGGGRSGGGGAGSSW